MSSIDQQFIEYIVKSLVGNPDAVQITRTIDEKGVLLELTVDPQDLGRVIGKRGTGAQALRTLLRALGTKNDARYNLKIIDNGEPHERRERPPREDRNDDRGDEQSDQQEEDRSEASAAETSDAVEASAQDTEAATEDTVDEDSGSSVADRTRKELADLDDLDI